jgi:hypothetical protein
MSTQKHTPGPWTLNYPHPASDNFIIGNDLFEDFILNPIAEIMPPVCESEAQQLDEQEANAKLMTASPLLLIEAQKLIANIKDYLSDVEDVNSIIPINGMCEAIKKATE